MISQQHITNQVERTQGAARPVLFGGLCGSAFYAEPSRMAKRDIGRQLSLLNPASAA